MSIPEGTEHPDTDSSFVVGGEGLFWARACMATFLAKGYLSPLLYLIDDSADDRPASGHYTVVVDMHSTQTIASAFLFAHGTYTAPAANGGDES